MVKNEMLKMVAEKANTSQKEADAVLAAYVEVVKEILAKDENEKVALGNIGSFKVKSVPERRGIIRMGERAGEEYVTPAHSEITFKMSKTAKML